MKSTTTVGTTGTEPLTGQDLAAMLVRYRMRHTSEKELQIGLACIFDERRITYVREHHLGPGDVIDFLVEGGIGVEVKVGGGLSEVTRQLHRYAGHDAVRELVLVSSRSRLDNLPATLRGKPLTVAVLRAAFV